MGDRLEQFVMKNREEFDRDEPSDKVWQNIRKKSRSGDQWIFAWKTAAVLLLISTLYLVLERKMDLETEDSEMVLTSEFDQVESYYTTLISQRRQEISQYSKGSLERDFLMEIDRLDQMYAQLKRTYQNQNSSDIVTDAMISNLQLRMNILNKQLEILKELKQQEDERDSTI